MGKAIGFGLTSLLLGTCVCIFHFTLGIVVSISIIGAGIIYHLDRIGTKLEKNDQGDR